MILRQKVQFFCVLILIFFFLGIPITNKKDSPDSENDLSAGLKQCKPLPGTNMSSSYTETTDASESSVTNSPNVRATKSKGKKGKKKKR